ncbi:hypothetical protein D6D13_00164 [Aureobasidium pullulans]|uniref:DUF676 domain-containing protein n=1 Tax=Aureobasidium pullulans TaxID=5580 RepID=A0A4V4J2X4_AURPU|nr:hypothetical protein D6D13_00164 [Aureobasidium pullulans]
MPTKSLLLVFIHGFKGGDHTFDGFPDHFRTLVQNALPKINVLSIVYPKFETQGDLYECVTKFHGWLLDKCIDLEVANNTPSPTVDPSVRVVLVGHSMGGIVAAETLLSIARDQPVPSSRTFSSTQDDSGVGNKTTSNPTSKNNSTVNLEVPESQPTRSSSAPPQEKPPIPSQNTDPDQAPEFLFPYIQAVLAFDTPYLGIHPGVVAHGAETHYNNASAAYNAYNQASQFFGLGNSSKTPAPPTRVPAGALPAPEAGAWGKWGKYAMFAGGAAALAAAGGAVWQNRDHISKGWAWAGGHLEFVGCLARGADLTKRVESVAQLSSSHKIAFADFYTCLDQQKLGKTYYSEQILGEERTFCVVPKEAKEQRGESPLKKRKTTNNVVDKKLKSKGTWVKCINEKANSEIAAHVAMFTPKDNPDYYAMADRAKVVLVKAVDKEWYERSEPTPEATPEPGADAEAEKSEGEKAEVEVEVEVEEEKQEQEHSSAEATET